MAEKVEIDIPGIGLIEAKNAATEATLLEILEVMKGTQKDANKNAKGKSGSGQGGGGGGGKEAKEGAENQSKLNRANKDGIGAAKAFAAGGKLAGSGLKLVGQSAHLATYAVSGLAAGAASLGKKNPAVKSNPTDSVGKYNTKDSDGTIRNLLKMGPKIVGTGSVAGDFDVAFKKAKTSGAKEFDFKGKKYNTKTRSEEFDYFDIVMEHLISGGYVDTNEDAVIMMSALDENAIARIAALSEQKFRIINKDGTETISDTPLHRGSGAASTVKPIGTGAKYSYKDENPRRPRAGESD